MGSLYSISSSPFLTRFFWGTTSIKFLQHTASEVTGIICVRILSQLIKHYLDEPNSIIFHLFLRLTKSLIPSGRLGDIGGCDPTLPKFQHSLLIISAFKAVFSNLSCQPVILFLYILQSLAII